MGTVRVERCPECDQFVGEGMLYEHQQRHHRSKHVVEAGEAMTEQSKVEELRSHIDGLVRWSLYDWKHNRNSPSCEGRYHGALRMLELFDALHARQGQEPPQ